MIKILILLYCLFIQFGAINLPISHDISSSVFNDIVSTLENSGYDSEDIFLILPDGTSGNGYVKIYISSDYSPTISYNATSVSVTSYFSSSPASNSSNYVLSNNFTDVINYYSQVFVGDIAIDRSNPVYISNMPSNIYGKYFLGEFSLNGSCTLSKSVTRLNYNLSNNSFSVSSDSNSLLTSIPFYTALYNNYYWADYFYCKNSFLVDFPTDYFFNDFLLSRKYSDEFVPPDNLPDNTKNDKPYDTNISDTPTNMVENMLNYISNQLKEIYNNISNGFNGVYSWLNDIKDTIVYIFDFPEIDDVWSVVETCNIYILYNDLTTFIDDIYFNMGNVGQQDNYSINIVLPQTWGGNMIFNFNDIVDNSTISSIRGILGAILVLMTIIFLFHQIPDIIKGDSGGENK